MKVLIGSYSKIKRTKSYYEDEGKLQEDEELAHHANWDQNSNYKA